VFRVTHIAIVLASATALVAARSSAADGVDAVGAYRKARAEAPAKLRALAEWSEAGQLFLERNRACEAVLALEPDDESARRTLHYARGKDGQWTRGIVPKSSAPDAEHAAEVAAKHEEAFAAFRGAVLGLVAGKEGDIPTRERALDELVAFEPDCAEARAADRQELVDGKWMLAETATTKRRRKDLLAAVETARKTCPAPTKGTPTADEVALATWTDVRDGGTVRVLCAPKVPEADVIARNADIVTSIFPAVSGVAVPATGRVRMFVYANKTDGLAGLERDKRLTADDRAWAKDLASFNVPKTYDVHVWHSEKTRVESCLRRMVAECLWRSLAVKNTPMWAREGTNHWYSELLLGTHACYYLRRTEYAEAKKERDELHKRLFDDAVDWMMEARTLEKTPRWPDLRISLSCDSNTSTAEDTLAAYCLVRYLIEARPEMFANVMRAFAEAKSSPDIVAASLGATVEGLDRRLRRWLRETK